MTEEPAFHLEFEKVDYVIENQKTAAIVFHDLQTVNRLQSLCLTIKSRLTKTINDSFSEQRNSCL